MFFQFAWPQLSKNYHLLVGTATPRCSSSTPTGSGLANAVMPAGSTFSATGVLGYEYSGWELWPTSASFGAPPVLPRAVRARNPFEFTVGSYNLLNLNRTTTDYAQPAAPSTRRTSGSVLGAPTCWAWRRSRTS